MAKQHPPQTNSTPAGLIVRPASEIQMRAVDWLWRPLLVAGGVNMFIGMPGVGKGVVSCDIAARISTGEPWPAISGRRLAGNSVGTVAILSVEDSPETTTVPRLKAAGADLDKILIVDGVRRSNGNGEQHQDNFDIGRDVAHLRALRAQCSDLRMVVIDPLDSYINARVDTHVGNQVRAALWPLKEWSESAGVAVLFIHHFNKTVTTNALDKVSGARSFGALPRSVWAVGRDEAGDRCVVLPIKANLIREDEKQALAFTIEPSSYDPDVTVAVWQSATVTMTAGQLLGERGSQARNDAADWLRDMLADGPVDSGEILEHAKQAGHSENTLRRAKKDLNIIAEQPRSPASKKIEGWDWRLPNKS